MSAVELDTVGYYGKPIVAAHVWDDTIGWYFFTGGIAGAPTVIALAADLAGLDRLATHARRASMIGLLPSPVLLVADLARPERFANMLRVFKPTSPMSMGSWLLAVYSPAAVGSWFLGEIGRAAGLRLALAGVAAVSGSVVATYTAVLVADTATPVWHEARRELPYVFAASATASAGAMAAMLSALTGSSDPVAGAIGVVGALGEVAAARDMTRRLGDLSTYDSDPTTLRYTQVAKALSVAGAVGLVVAARRSRVATVISSAAVLGGSLAMRMSVLRAGTASANDPRSVILQQTATA